METPSHDIALVAASATAHAGSTITDESYWPNEARQSAQNRKGGARNDLNSAFAYDRTASRLQPATNPNGSVGEASSARRG